MNVWSNINPVGRASLHLIDTYPQSEACFYTVRVASRVWDAAAREIFRKIRDRPSSVTTVAALTIIQPRRGASGEWQWCRDTCQDTREGHVTLQCHVSVADDTWVLSLLVTGHSCHWWCHWQWAECGVDVLTAGYQLSPELGHRLTVSSQESCSLSLWTRSCPQLSQETFGARERDDLGNIGGRNRTFPGEKQWPVMKVSLGIL